MEPRAPGWTGQPNAFGVGTEVSRLAEDAGGLTVRGAGAGMVGASQPPSRRAVRVMPRRSASASIRSRTSFGHRILIIVVFAIVATV